MKDKAVISCCVEIGLVSSPEAAAILLRNWKQAEGERLVLA